MRAGNRLNEALKRALKDRTEPLHEGQWEKIRAELGGKNERKRLFWPWMFAIGFTLLAGFGVYHFGTYNKETVAGTHVPRKQSSANHPGTIQKKESSYHVKNDSGVATYEQASGPQEVNESGKSRSLSAGREGTGTGDQAGPSVPGIDIQTGTGPDQSGTATGTGITQVTVIPSDTLLRNSVLSGPDPIVLPAPETGIAEKVDTLNTDKFPLEPKRKQTKPSVVPPQARFVLGLSLGASSMNTELTDITNESKIHRDTRKVFAAATDDWNAFFLDVNFGYRPFRGTGFGVSSGIQYRMISGNAHADYELRDIPFRDTTGDILFYLTLPDSVKGARLELRGRNSISYLMIPFSLSYEFRIGPRNEIGLHAGIVVSVPAGSSGNTFSMEKATTIPLGESLGKAITTGYRAGLRVKRHLYGQWWTGFDWGVQENRQSFELGPGTLNSRMKSNQFSLMLQYRF